VFVAPARPASLLRFSFRLRSSAESAFELLGLLYVGAGPEAESYLPCADGLGRANLARRDPGLKSLPRYSDLLSCLARRVGLCTHNTSLG